MLLRCFVFDGEPEAVQAMAGCGAPWVVAMASNTIWGQRDWHPRITRALEMAPANTKLLLPTLNAPAPDWQEAGPGHADYFAHRAQAPKSPIGVIPVVTAIDVTRETSPAVPVCAVVRAHDAQALLSPGYAGVHERARKLGRVLLISDLYLVQRSA
jgi:hypothetical protein